MVLILFYIASLLPIDGTIDQGDTLVICPVEFQLALKPWVAYREKQGYKIVVQPPASTSFGVKAQVKQFSASGSLKNVVLIGDAVGPGSAPERLVPTDYVTAKVNVNFGSEPEIATDHCYADLDDDGSIDLNIGRIPVDSADELTSYVRRIIKYESAENLGSWQRRVNFVAGVGGFGQMLDKMIEQSVKTIVTDLIPSGYDLTMTYGNWRSPYCPDPRQFSQTAIARFNEGCLFWIYAGHGDRRCLDQIRLPDQRFDILNEHSVSNISANDGSPIAILLSCYTAAIDDVDDGLAEMMLKQTQGPVAVISSTRVSMPYAMSIFSLEMLDGYFNGQAATLGELVKQSKQKMVEFDPTKSRYHQLVESMGKTFSPQPNLLVQERYEHVHLMHLLGDPLLQLQRPAVLALSTKQCCCAGETIEITGVAEHGGTLHMDISYRRDRFKNRPPRRRNYNSSNISFASYQKVYDKTQDLISNSKTIQVERGPFSVKLPVPEACSGNCHVRGLLTAENYTALGSKDCFVESSR